jgi:hypothetical protein
MEKSAVKKEIIEWVSTLDDESTLMILEGIKRTATFNFDEEFKKGIPLEEFRSEMIKRVRNYPWKKNGTVSE